MSPCPFAVAEAFPGGYGIRPYNPIKKQPPAQASYLGGRLLF